MELVSVKGVILDQVSDMPFIILQTADRRRSVSIGVGPAEAIAIIMALEGLKAPRPLTHDLFVHFFLLHRFKVEKVEIYEMVGLKYFAKLHYRRGLRRYALEVRPSDALALAVRLRTPIYVNGAVLDAQSDRGPVFSEGSFFKGDSAFFEFKN